MGGRVVSRTITIHTLEGSRRLSIAELLVTTVHELGHIWCCYGPGTNDGHWADTPDAFSSVGLMHSPMTCTVARGSEPTCPSVFSGRELQEMGLTAP
jgi:hypothetical protein